MKVSSTFSWNQEADYSDSSSHPKMVKYKYGKNSIFLGHSSLMMSLISYSLQAYHFKTL